MKIKVHYRIMRDRAGLPQDFHGARRFVVDTPEDGERLAREQLVSDYQIADSDIEICHIEQ